MTNDPRPGLTRTPLSEREKTSRENLLCSDKFRLKVITARFEELQHAGKTRAIFSVAAVNCPAMNNGGSHSLGKLNNIFICGRTANSCKLYSTHLFSVSSSTHFLFTSLLNSGNFEISIGKSFYRISILS